MEVCGFGITKPQSRNKSDKLPPRIRIQSFLIKKISFLADELKVIWDTAVEWDSSVAEVVNLEIPTILGLSFECHYCSGHNFFDFKLGRILDCDTARYVF